MRWRPPPTGDGLQRILRGQALIWRWGSVRDVALLVTCRDGLRLIATHRLPGDSYVRHVDQAFTAQCSVSPSPAFTDGLLPTPVRSTFTPRPPPTSPRYGHGAARRTPSAPMPAGSPSTSTTARCAAWTGRLRASWGWPTLRRPPVTHTTRDTPVAGQTRSVPRAGHAGEAGAGGERHVPDGGSPSSPSGALRRGRPDRRCEFPHTEGSAFHHSRPASAAGDRSEPAPVHPA